MNIHTEKDEKNNIMDRPIYFKYTPTDYSFLESLFTKYCFNNADHFVDFGCGKGRVIIVAAYNSCKHVLKYEMNIKIYKILLENVNQFKDKFNNNSTFNLINTSAEKASINKTANKFFFYNPFHLKVHMKVINLIQDSLVDNPRHIYFFI